MQHRSVLHGGIDRLAGRQGMVDGVIHSWSAFLWESKSSFTCVALTRDFPSLLRKSCVATVVQLGRCL